MTAKKTAVLALVFLISNVDASLCLAASKGKYKLLKEGFVLNGVDGELIKAEADKWFFKFDVEAADDKTRIEPGQSLQLLPCGTLEKMASAVKNDAQPAYRLWGRVTRYKNGNLIFPSYYLPISKAAPAKAAQEPRPAEPKPSGPDDAVVIPAEVLRRLKPKRTVAVARLARPLEAQTDNILADRIGFITGPKDSNNFVFELDALGHNLQQRCFGLLPCQVLERAEADQADELRRVRYKVAGILTKYKGQDYLLLQRAQRLYSHGNFAR